MPFQSEKQRRYLHANHPEIAKRWERDYAHGGILDINESEEIISDDGNDIELTDYNAAFDEPNGVKSLFRAKEGGNVRLGPHTATDLLAKKNPDGTRSKYQPPGGGATSLGSGRDAPGSDRGPRDEPDRGHAHPGIASTYSAPSTSTPTPTPTKDDHAPPGEESGPGYISPADLKKLEMQELIKTQEEDRPTEYYGLRDLQNKQQVLQTQIKDKLEGDWKRYVDPSAWDTIKNLYALSSFSGIVKEVFKGIKRSSDMNAFMQDLKDLGLAGGPPGTNDPLYDQLWLHLEKQKAKYKYDDDEKGDGPIYDPVTGAVDEEFAQGEDMQGVWDPRDWMAEIRARQAIYQGLKSGWENQQLNSGGLANLFRVKNKY
jgi:hypothetical protein